MARGQVSRDPWGSEKEFLEKKFHGVSFSGAFLDLAVYACERFSGFAEEGLVHVLGCVLAEIFLDQDADSGLEMGWSFDSTAGMGLIR